MANNIDTLRDYLFDTLDGLKSGKIEVDQARAIASIAGEISKTARLEIDYMLKTGRTRKSEFIEADRIEGITPLKIAGGQK